MRWLPLLALMLFASVAIAAPSDKATPLEQRAEREWKDKQASGSRHLSAAAAAIADFQSQLLAVDFGTAQATEPTAPAPPVVTPPMTPSPSPALPPFAPGPLPDLSNLLPNLANLSNLIPPGLLPIDVTPGAFNPIVTSLFEMFFKFLGVLSRMQLGTATAEDLATLKTIQSQLSAGFALLPVEAQQQLGPAFAKITEILQTIHDELAAQIGVPPTAPTNATEPIAPELPTNATEPLPAETEPAVPEPAPVTPAPTLKHKHSVIKKKLEPILLRESVFTISQRPRRDDPRDRSPRRDDDWRGDRRCSGRRGGCYQPGRRRGDRDRWNDRWDDRRDHRGRGRGRGRHDRHDRFNLMQATEPAEPTTPPAVDPTVPSAPANPVSPTNPLAPFLPPGLENLLPSLMKPNPIAAKLFELFFKFLGVLSKMQEGTADATDLATLESIQTDLTGGFAALPADVQTQLQGAFDKLISGLEAIKAALASMIGGAPPVTPPPTAPTNATEPTEPTAPAEPTTPVTPAQAIMMRSQLQNINLRGLMRSSLQLAHLMLRTRLAVSKPVRARIAVQPTRPTTVRY